jgi:hypothetical protein
MPHWSHVAVGLVLWIGNGNELFLFSAVLVDSFLFIYLFINKTTTKTKLKEFAETGTT